MPTALSPSRNDGRTNRLSTATNGVQMTNGAVNGAASSSSSSSTTLLGGYHANGNGKETTSEGEAGEDEDWLLSDDDGQGETRTLGTFAPDSEGEHTGFTMSNRDSAKVQRSFYDTGYREGITAGKLSTLQGGFDQGFNQSAPVGRLRGLLRGEVTAAQIWLEQQRQQQQPQYQGAIKDGPLSVAPPNIRNGVAPKRSNATLKASQAPPTSLSSEDKENVRTELSHIMSNLTSLDVVSLLEPDWEALAHEKEHATQSASKADGNASIDNGHEFFETPEAKRVRETRLTELQRRVDSCLDRTLQ